MTDIFSGVDAVMSKKYFRHIISTQKEKTQNTKQPQTHAKTHTKKQSHSTSHLHKQVSQMEAELQELLQELATLRKPAPKPSQQDEEQSQKQLLREQLHDLEKRLMEYEQRPQHNQDHIKSLQKRIHHIKLYLQTK